VISKETGGNSGRRVLFRTDSGEASVERIAEVDPDIYRTAENGGNG
jgi:chemotaxis receptor (MCP) glutamine deamidase CheD